MTLLIAMKINGQEAQYKVKNSEATKEEVKISIKALESALNKQKMIYDTFENRKKAFCPKRKKK